MKERTKDRVKDGFGCLVNNAAALRGAKNGPLWLTILMFFLSVLLPVLPLFISAANTKGSAFISSNSYGLERYVTAVATNLKNDNYEFVIGEDHSMTFTHNGSAIDCNAYVTFDAEDKATSATPLTTYVDSVTGENDLMVYISDLGGSTKKAKNLNTYISKEVYKKGTAGIETDITATDTYRSSYVILFKDTIYVVVFYQGKAISASLGGNYNDIKANNTCLNTLLTVVDKEGNAVAASLTNPDYYNGVLKNFKKFLDKTYDAIKWRNTFATSGIYLAIFVGLSLFMGLLMWIMTRGKNNPNNYFSLWLCLKLEARLALSPGLITLIVGIFLTSYASMIFILTLGLRVMWISMKELRPVQQ